MVVISHPGPLFTGGFTRTHALSSFANQVIPDAGIGTVRPLCDETLEGGCPPSDQQVAEELVLAIEANDLTTGEVSNSGHKLPYGHGAHLFCDAPHKSASQKTQRL